eukprot:9492926-Pyramimonas_sp.AAC.1
MGSAHGHRPASVAMGSASWGRFFILPLTVSTGIASTSETARTVVDLVDLHTMSLGVRVSRHPERIPGASSSGAARPLPRDPSAHGSTGRRPCGRPDRHGRRLGRGPRSEHALEVDRYGIRSGFYLGGCIMDARPTFDSYL